MLAEYQKKTNYGIAFGLLLQLGSTVFSDNPIGLLVLIIGAATFIWGCCCYAIGKGYPGVLGDLGFLSLLGLIVLILLPDKNK